MAPEKVVIAEEPETEPGEGVDAPEPTLSPTDVIGGPQAEHALVQQFRLIVVEGNGVGSTFMSTRDRAVIGTHPTCDFVLDDRAVSRFHCEIAVVDNRAMLRDLGSRNGTIVNGLYAQSLYLADGVMLDLGRTKLRFDLGREQIKIPLSQRTEFGLMVGASPAMRTVFAILECAADIDATVLIEGETGTGKELAAESIHLQSERRDGPFIVVDCGAIPADLLESELFGHEKGAFTGAFASREGAFVAASGGTIFLDELGELGPELQPKLLRALERRQVKPVGSNHYVEVDVRVIAATNRSLRTEVNRRRFRSDLYYRLAVIQVRLPPLRERPDDLPVLVDQMVDQLGLAGQPGSEVVRSPELLASLRRHSWPGNIRELRNYLEQCIAFRQQVPHPHDEIAGSVEDLADPSGPFKQVRDRWNDTLERLYFERLLKRHDDNASAAARAAELGRGHLYRLLWRHGLR